MQNVVRLMATEPNDDTISFSDFWAIYPKRVAKKDAEKAWGRIDEGERIGIITALLAWDRVWRDKDPQFLPHPASWLNGERWTDELPPGFSLMPRRSSKAPQMELVVEEPTAMPDHVRAALAKIRAKK